MQRRELISALLRGTAGATLAIRTSSAARAAGKQLRENPFTLGVASGSPTHDSVVLWTRLLPAPGSDLPVTGGLPVRWEMAHDDRFRSLVSSGEALASGALAHSVHVEVPSLSPDRWYWYRFMTGEYVSPVGRTRTLPGIDARVRRMRLAYASCQRYEHGYFDAYRHMLADAPDLVVFLGDYLYEGAVADDALRSPGPGHAHDLASYRQRYAVYKREAPLQAMHAACPWLITWDDHEVHNDYAGLSAGKGGPPVADFSQRRAAAYQAWYEHLPVRAAVMTRALDGLSAGAPMRIHASHALGRLGAIHLLDNRQYRDRQACTRDGRPGSSRVDPAACPAWLDPARSMLGNSQEAWLARALARTEGPWNLVAQATVFGQRDNRRGPGQSLSNDTWDGYAPSRERVVAAMRANRQAMPVLLGGDVHANWVGHVKADYADPRSAAIGVEFCGTSLTSRGGDNAKVARRLAENPHFILADEAHRGYGLLELSDRSVQATLRVVDDVTQAITQIRTLARFEVRAGKPVIEPL